MTCGGELVDDTEEGGDCMSNLLKGMKYSGPKVGGGGKPVAAAPAEAAAIAANDDDDGGP